MKIVCRACLVEEGDMKQIFTTTILSRIRMTCAEALEKFSAFSVDENDRLPKYICKKCLSKLRAAHKFKILIGESFLKLTSLMSSENLENCTSIEKIVEDNSANDNIKIDSSFEIVTVDEPKNVVDENSLNVEHENIEILHKVKEKDIKKKEKKLYPCSLCNKISLTNDELKKHKTTHADIKSYFCKICQKSFRSKYHHKDFHSGDRKLQCEICAKVFLRAVTLQTHLLAHRNQLPFKCTYNNCKKSFPSNSRLQLHMKVHTNERNFICQYCSHAARDKQQLMVHIRYLHTNEKNFLCGTCGKAFVSPQARYYHAKRHENIRNHHCTHCDKSFVFAFGLREHMFTHTGEKRFPCSVCEARFSRKAHKEKHEARLHGINKQFTNRNRFTAESTTGHYQHD